MAEPGLEDPCYYKDDDTYIDPDLDLNYIDEKLQNVLGHFQKDFEGGATAEDHGSLFGGYGSFLPMHQRSPSARSYPKTLQRSQNHNRPRSLTNVHLEGVPKNSLVPSDVPPPLKHATTSLGIKSHEPKFTPGNGSAKLDPCLLRTQAAATVPLKSESSATELGDHTYQKRPRLRIKVRADCTSQKNAAIYSGLGLTSPSYSIGHSTEDSSRRSTKLHTTPVESPSGILQCMTSFPVTGAKLISPLHPNLLHLLGKKEILDDSNPYTPLKVHQHDFLESKNSKETQSAGETGTVEETSHGPGVNNVNDIISHAQKHSKKQIWEEKRDMSSDLKLETLSSPACNTTDSSKSIVRTNQSTRVGKKDVPLKKRDISKDWVKDKLTFTGVVNDESVVHVFDGAEYDQRAFRSRLIERTRGGSESFKMEISDNLRGLGRAKGDRLHNLSKEQPGVSKRKRDIDNELENHPKQKIVMSCTQYKQERLGLNEGLKKLPLKNETKSKGRQTNSLLTSPLVDERLRSDDILECKQRAQKKVTKLSASNEDIHEARFRHRANKMDQLKTPSFDHMPKNQNVEMIEVKDETKDIACSQGQASQDVEEWVQCESCDKWRLLPYGIKADELPDKWFCSMLNWLPGMNSCDVSEVVTNGAPVQYQPVVPLPKSNSLQNQVDQITTVASAGLPSFNQTLGIDTMLNRGKKRHKARGIPAPVNSSGVIQSSSLTKNSQQVNMKSRFLNDMDKPLLKANFINDSTTQHLSDYSLERYTCKQEEKQIDEGATKPKRLKLKTESDLSGSRTSKRVMAEAAAAAAAHSDKYRSPENCRNPGRINFSSSAGCPTSTTGRNLQNHVKQYNSKDGKLELKNRVQSIKTLRDTSPCSGSIGMNEHDERRGMKRKLKDRQDNQNSLEKSQSENNKLTEVEYRKEMKPILSLAEGHESSACRVDDKSNKKGRVTKIILSGSRDSLSVKNDKQQQQQQQQQKIKRIASQLTLDDSMSLKKDLRSDLVSTPATSSSSKVLDSRKRSSYQEVRGSPVESVSSSPVKSSSLNKLSLVRRGILRNDYASTSENSAGGAIKSQKHGSKLGRKQIGVASTGEVSGVFQAEYVQGPMVKCQDHDVSGEADSVVKTPFDLNRKNLLTNNEDTLGQHQQCLTDVHSLDSCKSAGRIHTIHNGANGVFMQKPVEDSYMLSEDVDKVSHNAEKVNKKISDLCSDTAVRHSDYRQRNIQVKISGLSNAKSGDLHSLDGKGIHEQNSGNEIAVPSNSARAELMYKKSQAHPHHACKQETPTHVCQTVSLSVKGSGRELPQPDISVHKKGAHQNAENTVVDPSMHRNAPSSKLSVTMPVKGYICSQAATDVLKEAEELRGHADHLKNSGFKFDSIMANFQAALKSLHGASLLENSTFDNGRSECVEMPQLQIYSSTAKLFETCAQEFEKHKEISAAALAYKCTEVAYLRAVYCKSLNADRDRLDLQSSLLMVPQGESPSSSASDIDSLYHQVTVDTTAISKGMASNAANQVTIVQNGPSVVRLLQITHDMSLAIEAFNKSHRAFQAANENLKKANNGGSITVKRVLDFSFHDIEEFIRLVRLANEAICSDHI